MAHLDLMLYEKPYADYFDDLCGSGGSGLYGPFIIQNCTGSDPAGYGKTPS